MVLPGTVPATAITFKTDEVFVMFGLKMPIEIGFGGEFNTLHMYIVKVLLLSKQSKCLK